MGCWALSAVHKVFPRLRLRVAWKVYDTWGQLQPPRQAPAAPPELLQAMFCVALLLNRPHLSCLMLVCYCGLLRVREGLRLQYRDVVFLPDSVVLCLGQTKRGLEQKVVLTNPAVVGFLSLYASHFPSKDGSAFFFPISYGTALRWVKKLGDLLGAAPLQLTTHTFRRSGASELARQGVPLADILLFGRWASERSAKEYIRRGEVAIHRARAELGPLTWARIQHWAQIGRNAWAVYDLLHQQHSLQLPVDRVTAERFRKFESLVFSSGVT